MEVNQLEAKRYMVFFKSREIPGHFFFIFVFPTEF